MAAASAHNMFGTIQRALQDYPSLERVLYMPHPPRFTWYGTLMVNTRYFNQDWLSATGPVGWEKQQSLPRACRNLSEDCLWKISQPEVQKSQRCHRNIWKPPVLKVGWHPLCWGRGSNVFAWHLCPDQFQWLSCKGNSILCQNLKLIH